MDERETLGAFFRKNKKLARDYFEIQMEIYRLRMAAAFSKTAGYLIWIIISLLLFFLFLLFISVAAGFWFSDMMGSYIKGFGLLAMIIFLKIIVLFLMRRSLFVNPIIRNVINRTGKGPIETHEEQVINP